LQSTRTHEAQATLDTPELRLDTLADYRATGLSLKAHPVGLLRPTLSGFKVQPAAVLRDYPHGRLARASGLVTHRQRPETAKGVVFVTLEDDTGSVNVIVWPAVAEAQRKPLIGATLLTVYGIWQREGEIIDYRVESQAPWLLFREGVTESCAAGVTKLHLALFGASFTP
jgi:error-prone DNA polymerase